MQRLTEPACVDDAFATSKLTAKQRRYYLQAKASGVAKLVQCVPAIARIELPRVSDPDDVKRECAIALFEWLEPRVEFQKAIEGVNVGRVAYGNSEYVKQQVTKAAQLYHSHVPSPESWEEVGAIGTVFGELVRSTRGNLHWNVVRHLDTPDNVIALDGFTLGGKLHTGTVASHAIHQIGWQKRGSARDIVGEMWDAWMTIR
jgi:hypothetical protein